MTTETTMPTVSLKVSDWGIGELLYPVEHTPSPRVLRQIADIIAADAVNCLPVTIDIYLTVQIAALVHPEGME